MIFPVFLGSENGDQVSKLHSSRDQPFLKVHEKGQVSKTSHELKHI